jgi:hypothetical protein
MIKYFIAILLLLPFRALAVDPLESLRIAAGDTGLVTNRTPIEIVKNTINIALTFVGSIVVILFLWAGFKWMTSAGNTEVIKKSRETIINAVIGLAIIFASYVIVNFVITSFMTGFGTGGNVIVTD